MNREEEELKAIGERYSRRLHKQQPGLQSEFEKKVVHERESRYGAIIRNRFINPSQLSVIEIGAGRGFNIDFFKRLGVLPENIYANELLADRAAQLKINHPDINVIEGNALDISSEKKFDIVFQSTVFTSVLDDDFRKNLAEKMKLLTKDNGIILWYDFMFDNPRNKDVRKVTVNEIRNLFPSAARIKFWKVTLAPPIGRRVGKLYPLFNLLPLLRTHVIAEIKFS